MKLAIAVVAVLCLTAAVSAEPEKPEEPRVLTLPEIKLPEIKLPQLLPKLQLPELKMKQQQDGSKPNRFRLSQLNIPLTNIEGVEMPKLPQLLPNISNPFNVDNLKSAAILSWLQDAGFYQLKNLTEEGGKVVIDMGKNNPSTDKSQEKPDTPAAGAPQDKDASAAAKREAAPAKAEPAKAAVAPAKAASVPAKAAPAKAEPAPAKAASAPAKTQSAPATTAASNMRQGSPNGNKAAGQSKTTPGGGNHSNNNSGRQQQQQQQQHRNQAHGQAQNQKKP